MSDACGVSCELVLSNDIMGIGVRAALYAQIILAWLASLVWPNTFIKNSRASYMTATAILVAALIQWRKNKLSVLDALVVSLMTSMMIIFVVVSGTSRVEAKPTTSRSETIPGDSSVDPAQASTPSPDTEPSAESAPPSSPQPALTRNGNAQEGTLQMPAPHPTGSPITMPEPAHVAPPNAQQQDTKTQSAAHASDPPAPKPEPPKPKPPKSKTQKFIRFCFVNLWGAWCYILWKDPVHFGLEGEKVICTTNNNVTIWVFGEYVQAVSPKIQIAALVLVSILYFVALCSLFFTLENVLEPVMRTFGSIGDILMTIPPKKGNPRAPAVKKPLHEDPVINRIHYLLHLFAFSTLLYLVICTEMTVRRNDTKKAMMDWSYGQVIALILLLQQFNDVCSTFVEGKEEEQDKKEQEEREKRFSASTANSTTKQDSIEMKVQTSVTRAPSPLPPVSA